MALTWRQILPANATAAGDALADRAMKARQSGKTIYPPQDAIFKALQLTPPENVKIVILGQDPYHNQGQAMGLSFSTPDINPINGRPLTPPPSLVNIYTELCREFNSPRTPSDLSNDLTPWAQQGVLLLNASLTVEHGQPASHSQWGWSALTGAVIEQCLQLPQTIVFLLWGSHAFKLMEAATAHVDGTKVTNKFLLKSTHPSPFSANRPSSTAVAFMGCGHFATANQVLMQHGVSPIDWIEPLVKH